MAFRRLGVLLAVVSAVTLLAASCGGDDDSEASPAEMAIGTWEKTTFSPLPEMQLNEDGSYEFFSAGGATGLDGGQYEVEGDLITFRTDDESAFCGGQTGQYQMTFDGPDTVNFELVEDECGARAGDIGSAQFVRTSG